MTSLPRWYIPQAPDFTLAVCCVAPASRRLLCYISPGAMDNDRYDPSGFDGDDFDGHGTHTAGTVAGATLNTPAEVSTCGVNQELG